MDTLERRYLLGQPVKGGVSGFLPGYGGISALIKAAI
jgi:hypothetical protein